MSVGSFSCCCGGTSVEFGVYALSFFQPYQPQVDLEVGGNCIPETWPRASDADYEDMLTAASAVLMAYSFASPPGGAWTECALSDLGGCDSAPPAGIPHRFSKYGSASTADFPGTADWSTVIWIHVNTIGAVPIGRNWVESCNVASVAVVWQDVSGPGPCNGTQVSDGLYLSRLFIVPASNLTSWCISETVRDYASNAVDEGPFSCATQAPVSAGSVIDLGVVDFLPTNPSTKNGYAAQKAAWFLTSSADCSCP